MVSPDNSFRLNEKHVYFHHILDDNPMLLNRANHAVHAHKTHEIFYFISGSADYLVEGTNYPMKPGGIMIMRSGEFHKIQIKGNQPYERFVLNFDEALVSRIDPEGKLLEPFLNRPLGIGNYFAPNGIRLGHIYETLKAIADVPNESEARNLAIAANLFSVLFEIRMAFYERDQKADQTGTANALCGEIISYINAHLTESLSLDQLSERFYISKNHLNRIFKASAGVTVWEYVKIKRLVLARNAILSGHTAIEACQSSGFNDYSAFYRAYKERYGISPKEASKL